MFESVKKAVSLLEVMSRDLQVDFKECGDFTYQIDDEKQYGGCPACSHNDCFKVRHDPENLAESFYHCFSCEVHGSIIDWTAFHDKLTPVEAARKLAKEFKVPLPNDYSPIQEIFGVAAGYYHHCLKENCNTPQLKLGKMTPLEYQTEVRKHSVETVDHFEIGWSDGSLIEFLEGVGYEDGILLESGLKNKKNGKDFLPSNCFIYPHYAKGKVSHFTFKDSDKKIAYQLPNKFVLNGFEFYNQDSIQGKDSVIVVEGENDLISVWARCDKEKYGVIATIGQISTAQLDWMRENLAGKNVITIFDPDDAGNKYRTKVAKIKASFKSLTQVKPNKDLDIDNHLKAGADLEEIISKDAIEVEVKTPFTPPKGLSVEGQGDTPTSDAVEETDPNSSILEKFGAYYRVKYKEGEPIFTKISNFTLTLSNVYINEDGDRLRELIVHREDGYSSEPVLSNSETKVSLKSFRVLLAKAADADFTGNEQDLIAMWSYVYSKGKETMVKVLRVVGRHDKVRGWAFRNKFISDTGVTVEPDENGIFWLNGKSVGIKSEGLSKSNGTQQDLNGIPALETELSVEEREELQKGFVQNLAKNLGDPGTALLMIAWMNSCAYSNTIFQLNHSFPFLFVWGSNGEGKGTICSWLMDTYDMAHLGKTAISQLKSGVGFGRKAEYYGSLPLWIDEIRADKDTEEYISTFRSYYDRTPRTMGTKEGFGIKSQEIRSCFMFAGEDHFEDPATKERCITARITKLNREKKESFEWIDGQKHLLSALGYQWLMESVKEDHSKLKAEIKTLDRELILEAKCSARKSKNWAAIGVFAIRLAAKYMPGFDMKAHLFQASIADTNAQKSETTVVQFWEAVEAITGKEGYAVITHNHIQTDGKFVHVWFPFVYKEVLDSLRGRMPFTKHALLSSIREEPYFVDEGRKVSMGTDGTRRTVITLDWDKCPDVIKNICRCNS